MATSVLYQTTLEEKLVFYGIALTYPIYSLGGVYVLGCVIGWLIFAVMCLRAYLSPQPYFFLRIPLVVYVWLAGMLVMLLALLIAHLDYQLSLGQTIKSAIGWAKGWALLALFPLLGALLECKQSTLVRACCWVSLHTLIFALLSVLCFILGFSGQIYLSPLKAIGGPGEAFFTVALYGLNPETGLPRWSFFAPWAPAAGLLSCVLLIICSQEKQALWRYVGVGGAVVMSLLSQSRAGWLIFLLLIPCLWLIAYGHRSWFYHLYTYLLLALLSVVLILISPMVFEWLDQFVQQVKDARPGSTRVRNALAQIALQRWNSEAFWFGHAVVERGPKMVEYMPIGSHHSWYGLLFVKGLVGAMALAVPLLMSVFVLVWDSVNSKIAQVALLLLIVLIAYSFFENLEILVYLYWPALMWIGMAFKIKTKYPAKHEG